jgi:hypothetical protein
MSVFKTTLQRDSVMVKKLDQPLVEFYKFTRGLKKNRKAPLQTTTLLTNILIGYATSIDNDLSKFAKLVHGIGQKGYDVGNVINEFSDLDSLRTDYLHYQAAIPDLQRKLDDLNQECSTLEQLVNSYNQKLCMMRCKLWDFCLEELKLLRNTINDIAYGNNIPAHQAQQNFYKDIEEQYDDK